MFTIISCFEVALRNAIDSLLVPDHVQSVCAKINSLKE